LFLDFKKKFGIFLKYVRFGFSKYTLDFLNIFWIF
jgi:hypothetical protein